MSKPLIKNTIKVAPFHISGSGRFYHFAASHQLAHNTKLSTSSLQNKHVRVHNMNSKTKWPEFVGIFKGYCESTTLHGWKYLTEVGRPTYERVYWLIAILAAYSIVTFVAYDQIERFFDNPVLISIEPTLTSISDIPFPALTFCPDSQILSSTYNLTWAINQPYNSTIKKDETYNFALSLCNLHDLQMFHKYYKEYFRPEFVHHMLNSINGEDHCNRLVSAIFWSEKELKDSCKYLQPTVTYFGACFTFNMMPRDQIFRNSNITMKECWSDKYLGGRKNIWSPDTGYKEEPTTTFNCLRNKTPPWISSEGSLITAVSFYLTIPSDTFDGSCSSGGKGFFVSLTLLF